MKTKLLITVSILAGVFFAFSMKSELNLTQDDEKWVVPENYIKMKNPVSADKESLSIGKELYNKHCKSCHGSTGEGDGPKAMELDTPCGDFTMEEFQAQTDGELFYKTKEGRDDMPSFKTKIDYEEDMWSVVNYMRTFASEE